MNTLTLGSPFLDPVASDQKQLASTDCFLLHLSATPRRAPQGAKPSSSFIEVRQASRKDDATDFTGTIFDSVTLAIGSNDEALSVLDAFRPSGVAALTRGNQVFRDVVESIAIQVVNDKIDASGPMSITPFDIFATPVTGMPTWPDVIKEDLAMLFDSSERPCQRVSMLAIQDSILDPVALIDLHAFLSSHNKYTTMGA